MKKQADVHVTYDKEVRQRGKGGTSPWPVFFVSEEGHEGCVGNPREAWGANSELRGTIIWFIWYTTDIFVRFALLDWIQIDLKLLIATITLRGFRLVVCFSRGRGEVC